MDVIKKWNYISAGESIEDYATCIAANAKSLVRIFELLEDADEKENFLNVGRLLSQSIWEYASLVTDEVTKLAK